MILVSFLIMFLPQKTLCLLHRCVFKSFPEKRKMFLLISDSCTLNDFGDGDPLPEQNMLIKDEMDLQELKESSIVARLYICY